MSPIQARRAFERPLRLLQDSLERAVLASPDKTAVVSGVDRISYGELNEKTIRKLCATQLKSCMVPSHIRLLPQLPKSANGKIDHQALAAMCSN